MVCPKAFSQLEQSTRTGLKLAEKTLRFIDGSFEIGLPWKDKNKKTHLPDSYPTALRLLKYTGVNTKRVTKIKPEKYATVSQSSRNFQRSVFHAVCTFLKRLSSQALL